MTARPDFRRYPIGLLLLVFFLALVLLHLPLVTLPYFWDEAGYYIPAARDLLLQGSLIPHSSISNAHPPLVMAYLALAWKLLGSTPGVTRTAMLGVAAFALLGVFRLAERVASPEVALASVISTALYPVFFTQSSFAQLDLAAAGFTFWGILAYVEGRRGTTALWFSLAVLSKETAILAPAALLLCRLGLERRRRQGRLPAGQEPGSQGGANPRTFQDFDLSLGDRWPLWVSSVPLALWYAYHWHRTGFILGNPEFLRYNLTATLQPTRILLAVGMRLWQVLGYMNLYLLTLATLLAGWLPPRSEEGRERPRIALDVQFSFLAVLVVYILAMSVLGGAVLARYLLPALPLMMILCLSTLRRRVRDWHWVVGIVALGFVLALIINPPYGFSIEDNLAYRDYILLHRRAETWLEANHPKAHVLTAWPASDELTRPYLGYVSRPFDVLRIEDFTAEQLFAATETTTGFDLAFVFSTKYASPYAWFEGWQFWQRAKTSFFGYHRDVRPRVAAQILGGRLLYEEQRGGQWVGIIAMERIEQAQAVRCPGECQPWDSAADAEPLLRHEMTGIGFHDQPHCAARFELQGVAGGQSELNFHFHPAIDSGRDHHVPLLERNHFPGDDIASAEPIGFGGREQNVAGPDPDAQVGTDFCPHQRGLQFNLAMGNAAGHGAAMLIRGPDRNLEDVLKTNQLCDHFLPGCGHYLVWGALLNHAALFEDNDALAEGEYLVAMMGDVHNGNVMLAIPGTQVVDDLRLGGRIQPR